MPVTPRSPYFTANCITRELPDCVVIRRTCRHPGCRRIAPVEVVEQVERLDAHFERAAAPTGSSLASAMSMFQKPGPSMLARALVAERARRRIGERRRIQIAQQTLFLVYGSSSS
jgi:hypothetical protein